MNKKLVAVAIAGMLAAPLAQAQTANVTLYGSFRVEAAYAKYSGPTGSTSVPSIDGVSSRWGLRGSESLGGSLNAIFQCESGFGSDGPATTGSNQMCGREGWVGLNGKWGEFKLGYGLTPYDDVLGLAHQQGSNSWENRNNGTSGGAGFAKQGLFTNFQTGQASTNSSAFDARANNSISYKTPNWMGFTLRTQYALLDESMSKSARLWDTAGIYTNGPFTGAVTYAYHKDFAGLGGNLTALNDQEALRGFASWNFGVAKVGGTIEQAKYTFDNAPSGYNSSYKFTYWDLGVTAPWQAWVFGAQYSNRDRGLAHAFNASTSTSGGYNPTVGMLKYWDEGGGDHWSATADYALSKRTLIRGYYSWMRNEGTYNTAPVVTGTNPMIGNSKVQAVSVGIWHNF
jgi:predicted porin